MSTEFSAPTQPPPDDRIGNRSRHLGLALVLISAAQLMVVLDATIVNIATPKLQTDLGVSLSNLSWVQTSYTIAFGGLLLLGGRMGDLLGRRKVFMGGVLLFAFASLLGGLAANQELLFAARALQGVGAAAASPTALALITTTFPAGPARNKAFGVYAAMSGAGAAVGLILGGVLTEIDWRWTFFVNVPIGVLVAFLAPRYLAESEPQRGRFDLPGAVTATLGLVSLVYGLSHKAHAGATWTELWTMGPILAGAALLVLFLLTEARSRHALLPVRIVADRTRAVSFLVMLVVGAVMFAMFFFLGLYIQQVLGYSPIRAGVAFLPFTVGIVAAAQTASALISRVDPRWISGVGGVLATASMWGYAQLEYDSSYWVHLFPWIVVQAFGMGLIFVPLTLTAVSRVRNEDQGVASAVLNTVQQVGGSLGLAVLGTVAANAATGSDALAGAVGVPRELAPLVAQTYGYTQAFTVGMVIMAVGTVLTLVGLKIRHEDLATDSEAAPPVHAS
jgi:EmrB/QacA subfamily drug resistance transporter